VAGHWPGALAGAVFVLLHYPPHGSPPHHAGGHLLRARLLGAPDPEASIFPLWAIATTTALRFEPIPLPVHCRGRSAVCLLVPGTPCRAVLAVGWSAVTSVYLNTTGAPSVAVAAQCRLRGKRPCHLNLGMSYTDPEIRATFLREAIRKAPNYILAI